MSNPFQQPSKPNKKSQATDAAHGLVLARVLITPLPDHPIKLEVQGIVAEVQARIQAPTGWGKFALGMDKCKT
jgi:hypothetical protein